MDEGREVLEAGLTSKWLCGGKGDRCEKFEGIEILNRCLLKFQSTRVAMLPFRVTSPSLPVETKSRSGSVRVRTQSIEEQFSNIQDGDSGGSSNRSDILNRISKMGQSMIPSGATGASGAGEEDIVRFLSYCLIRTLVTEKGKWV